MAYSVQQRSQEIGIRMALGAETGHVLKMVVFQGMRLALAGVVIGIGSALGLSRLLATFLFGVKERDLAVFIVVPVSLIPGAKSPAHQQTPETSGLASLSVDVAEIPSK